MGKVLVLALLAAWNPTLLAIVPVMLVSARPKRLMIGYLLGAYTVSITLGLIFVFARGGSSAASTTKHAANPAVNLSLGIVVLLIALGLAFRLDERLRRSKADREVKDKGPPRWRRALDKGSVPLAFAVGALFSLPGGRYILALKELDELHLASGSTVLAVVVVNLILLALVELPLISYLVAEEWTPTAVERARGWFSRHGRLIVIVAAAFIGTFLFARGLIALLS
jgi:Sap, sulfolipid-1-addressing protein